MTHMHFVSAHYGGEVPWIHEIKSPTIKTTSTYYSDKNTPSRHKAMSPRMKSKIPKMMEWQIVNADWYVWMDSSLKLKEGQEDMPASILKAAGENSMCFFRHSSANSIHEEARRVLLSMKDNHEYLVKRYTGEPILEQLIHYYGDPDFVDNQLYASGFFAYHRSAIPVMQEWFNQVTMWTLQCQLSLPYVLHKTKTKASTFEGIINGENEYFTWEWQKREKNLNE